jgi:hypothetical protein
MMFVSWKPYLANATNAVSMTRPTALKKKKSEYSRRSVVFGRSR